MTDNELNEKFKKALLTAGLILAMIAMGFAGKSQTKPRLDTIQGKVIFTDEKGLQYDVLRDVKNYKLGKSYIVKEGNKLFLFRRERN